MAQEAKKGGKRSPKGSRFGGKQKHGQSRASYFAQADYRIARNKRRRVEKEAKRQAVCAAKKQAMVVAVSA